MIVLPPELEAKLQEMSLFTCQWISKGAPLDECKGVIMDFVRQSLAHVVKRCAEICREQTYQQRNDRMENESFLSACDKAEVDGFRLAKGRIAEAIERELGG